MSFPYAALLTGGQVTRVYHRYRIWCRRRADPLSIPIPLVLAPPYGNAVVKRPLSVWADINENVYC